MALKNIIPSEMSLNEGFIVPDAVTLDASGCTVEYKGTDTKILLLVSGSALTVQKGNGIQGVRELVVTPSAGKTTALVLESGAFKNVSGEHKGKVFITGAGAEIKAILLP